MFQARTYPVISAENILELQASDVRLFWGTSIPASGLRDCEVRLAKEAAATAGFDLVTITANIHPTTTRGTRRDKPHLTVKFRSTRYNQQTEQIVHINVHVWNPRSGTWTQYPSSRRPDNFPYHYVFQDGDIRFYRSLPKVLAQNEIDVQEQRRRQEAEERRRQEERRREEGRQEERRREEEEERWRQEERRRQEDRQRREERRRREEYRYGRDDGRSRDRDRDGYDPRQYTRDSRDSSDEAGGSSGRYYYGGRRGY